MRIIDIRNRMNNVEIELPVFLEGIVGLREFRTWLTRKAKAQLRRDRKRGNTKSTFQDYKLAIYKAIVASGGL